MIKKKGAELSIGIDGEAVHDGKLLLTSVANGCFCGGGIKSNPVACVSDGVMNVNIIKNIKRRHFIPLLPHYMKGTILDVNNIDRFLINRDCQKLIIKPMWEEYNEPTDRIVFNINPGMSFGTGSHYTTQLCLEALEQYIKPGDKMLDLGCGSGILSIISLKSSLSANLGEISTNVTPSLGKFSIILNSVILILLYSCIIA